MNAAAHDHDRGPSIALLADMLAERAEDFCRDFLPEGRKDGPRWRAGDVYGSRGQSLSVLISGPQKGSFKDFSNPDQRGDLIDLLCLNQMIDKKEAYKRACQWLGISRETGKPSVSRHAEARLKERAARRAQETEKHSREKIGWARDLYRRARRAAGTIGEAYFRGRGISLEMPAMIGFVPLLKHTPTRRDLPCVIGFGVGPDSESEKGYGIVFAHRIFLEVEGLTAGEGAKNFLFESHVIEAGERCLAEPWRVKKVAHDAAKMMLGSPIGGCIPLTPRPTKSRLAFSEGIENGMAWAQANPDASVRAVYSAANMMNVMVPLSVRELIFIKDGTSGTQKVRDPSTGALVEKLDAEGKPVKPADEILRKAAQVQKDIAADAGRSLEVKIWHSEDGMDANDMLREGML